MVLLNSIRSNFLLLYLFILSSSIHSRELSTKTSFSSKLKSAEYKSLTKLCYIENYSAWLQREQEIHMWIKVANILGISLSEDVEFQKELEQYRLQHECLRLVERLPLSIGPG